MADFILVLAENLPISQNKFLAANMGISSYMVYTSTVFIQSKAIVSLWSQW